MKQNNEKIIVFQDDLPDDFILLGDLAIDTETMGLNLLRDRLCLLQLSNGDGVSYLIQFLNKAYDAPNLKRLLGDKTRNKIFHFARFDIAAIKHYLNINLENIFCTKIASKLVRTYSEAHGLKELCREFLNIQLSKQQQSSHWGSEILTREQKEYAAKDVLYLHQLREVLRSMLIESDRIELATKIFAFLPTRVELDLKGWQETDIFMH